MLRLSHKKHVYETVTNLSNSLYNICSRETFEVSVADLHNLNFNELDYATTDFPGFWRNLLE